MATSNDDMNRGTTKTTLTSKGLRFAPPELRRMLFCAVFEDESKGDGSSAVRFPVSYSRLPVLLKVLRDSDKELYREALTAWSEMKHFFIPFSRLEEEDEPEGDISMAACKLVKKLEVSVNETNWVYSRYEPTNNMKQLLFHAKNIEELFVRFVYPNSRQDSSREMCESIVRRCVISFPNLTKVTLWANQSFLFQEDRTSVWASGQYVFSKSTATVGWGWPKWTPYPAIFDKIDQVFDIPKDDFALSIKSKPYICAPESLLHMDIDYKCKWEAQSGRVLEWNDDPVTS